MQRDVIFSHSEGILVAAIQKDIDHHTAKPMREKIDDMLAVYQPNTLVLDFSAVVFMDSSGLGLIMGRAEYASKHDCLVVLDGLSPALRKLVSLCGLDRVKNLSLVTKERNYPR